MSMRITRDCVPHLKHNPTNSKSKKKHSSQLEVVSIELPTQRRGDAKEEVIHRLCSLKLSFISAEKKQRRRGRREEILCFFFAEAKKRTNCRREIVGDWHLF
jgi:hypothetical protein